MSEYAGDVHTVKAARAEHECSWCGQKIEIGQPFVRWLWFCDGSRSTVKAHPECLKYAQDEGEIDDGFLRFDRDGYRPDQIDEVVS